MQPHAPVLQQQNVALTSAFAPLLCTHNPLCVGLSLLIASRRLDAASLTTARPPPCVTHPGSILFSYIGHENEPPVFSDIKLQQKSPVVSKSARRRLLTDIRSTEDQTDIEKLKKTELWPKGRSELER